MRYGKPTWALATFVLLIASCNDTDMLMPKEIDARPLSELQDFDAQDREAVRAAIDRLNLAGDNVSDFYLAPIRKRADGLLELSVWHRAAFEQALTSGSPGGKSRTMVYDPTKKSIIEEWGWQ